MLRRILRSLSTGLVLLLAITLTGCIFMFTIVGADTYHVNGIEGLLDGPVIVDVTWKGFIPRWPDIMKFAIRGKLYNSGYTTEMLDDEADAISGTIYDHLDFDTYSGSLGEGNPFWVKKEIDVPSFWSLLPLGSGGHAVGSFQLELSDVVGASLYDAIMDELEYICASEMDGNTWIELSLEGSIETSGGKIIGTLECSFILYGNNLP